MDPVNLGKTITQMVAVASDASRTSGAPPSVAGLVPEPSATGDIAFDMAKMMIENAYTTRAQAREDRKKATAAMIAAQKDQIAQMHEATEKRYAAAQLEAWGKIADGGAGIAGGVLTVSGGNADKSAGWGSAMKSGGGVASGVAGLAAVPEKCAAEDLDTAAKAAENEATQHKHAVEAAGDEIKEAREHARAVLDFLQQFESMKTKSLSSAIKA